MSSEQSGNYRQDNAIVLNPNAISGIVAKGSAVRIGCDNYSGPRQGTAFIAQIGEDFYNACPTRVGRNGVTLTLGEKLSG
jgi:hypothetical protein